MSQEHKIKKLKEIELSGSRKNDVKSMVTTYEKEEMRRNGESIVHSMSNKTRDCM
jgi:hypothetical protein